MNTEKITEKQQEVWNYYRDELSNDTNSNNNLNKNVINSESLNTRQVLQLVLTMLMKELLMQKVIKSIILIMMQINLVKKNLEILVPLKYLSNFWRSLKMPLISCEVFLTLNWSENCVITSMERRVIKNTLRDISPTNAPFKITERKLYVRVATLSTKDDNNFLEQLKSGFKRTIKWNKYRSEMTIQTKTNHLNYLVDPAFTKVNRLFVLSLENEEDRTSFSKYHVPKVETKDFNVLINGKIFFDVIVKNEEEAYEKIMSISKNNDYTTGNLLDYEYFSKHYKLIAIDLSKQIELENPDLRQQINFIGKLEADSVTMFFITEKSEETTFEFLQNSVSII